MKKQCKWIEALSAIAAILTAGASIWTLRVNIVERREVDALQTEAIVQKQTLSNALERVNLYGDILAAGGGDRWAYKRAKEYLLLHSADEGTAHIVSHPIQCVKGVYLERCRRDYECT